MPDLIDRSTLLRLMEVQAESDVHPGSCYRMIRLVQNAPHVQLSQMSNAAEPTQPEKENAL